MMRQEDLTDLTMSSRLDSMDEEAKAQVKSSAGQPGLSAVVDALEANWQYVDELIAGRWYLMRAAREAGATWDEIGAALGMTRQGANDWYHRRKVAVQEQPVGGLDDAERPRAALGLVDIPPRAWEAADAVIAASPPQLEPAHLTADAITAAAPIVVAAELRRLARSHHGRIGTQAPKWVRDVLLSRATELDPEATA
jgi:hypothetical protein